MSINEANLRNLLRRRKIFLKSTGEVAGKIFKLGGDKEYFYKIGTLTLLGSGVISIAQMVVKSLSGAQDMLIDGISKSNDGDVFLHGCCLNMHKPSPTKSEQYIITDTHQYKLDAFARINTRIDSAITEMQANFGRLESLKIDNNSR